MTENTTDETVDEMAPDEVAPTETEAAPDEVAPTETEAAPDEVAPTETEAAPDDAETFPRDYVEKLRDENAKYRQRAKDRDEIAARLHTALVAATGRLQDPSDLEFDDEHLSDPGALTAAVDALLEGKPHLASRKPAGNIGQGVSAPSDTFSIVGALRANAS